MQSLFRSRCRNRVLRFATLAAVGVLASTFCATAQRSDLELLRSTDTYAATPTDQHRPYGLEEGKRTLDPFYHLFSTTLYVWQNVFEADVAAPGGYAVSNPEYFKELCGRYGIFRSLFYGLDRAVRNTKMGRVGYERYLRDADGAIVDNTDRYSTR